MTLEDARHKLPLDTLMAMLGHGEAAKPKSKSPFREEKNASFGIYRSADGRLRWKDHGTGEGGDEVDYIATLYKIPNAEAVKQYIELAGGKRTEPKATGKYKLRNEKLPVFSWQEYQDRATGEFLQTLAAERAISIETLTKAKSIGILGATEDGHPAFVVNGGSGCHYRIQDGSWRYEPKGQQTIPLVFGDPKATAAWVFESQWDALAILDRAGVETLDQTLYVVTRGANNGKLAADPCDGKIVTAWPQNDSAKADGKVPSEIWLTDIRSVTNQCRVARIPGQHKDANDWVEAGATKEEILALATEAVLPELADIHVFSAEKLLTFVPENDPTCLLGDRWLCRGGSALMVGPSGVGKSSLAAQMAVLWSLGLPACGIKPKRPLKSVFVQAENDEGDMAEMVQGVYRHAAEQAKKVHNMDPAETVQKLNENVIFCRDTIHCGESFATAADALAGAHKPDLFWCDPLLSYVGDDISSQRVASQFLRGLLNPISFRHKFAWVMVHHTGKPPGDAKARQKWTDSDFSYVGLGSSELTNWARACLYLEQVDGGMFALRLTKRGKRAGVVNEHGFPIYKMGLEHGEKHICWEPCDLPKEGEKEGDPTALQMDDAMRLYKEGLSLRKIITKLGLKNSKGSNMQASTLARKLAATTTQK